MLVPLIVCANPFSCVSPKVFLLDGEWEIISNHKSSLVAILTDNDISPTPYKEGLRIEGNQTVQIKFLQPEKETVSISAKLCR